MSNESNQATPRDASELAQAADAFVAAIAHDRDLALRVTRETSLASFTTFGVGGPALVHVEVHTEADVRLVADTASDSGLPIATIGQGSNLLIADTGVAAVVVTMAGEFAAIDIEQDLTGGSFEGVTLVRAGGAVKLPVLARQTVAAGLIGFEWAVGVPGSVGGAIRMNAGGHGSDMRASVRSATVLETAVRPAVREERPVEMLDFGYRGSSIQPGDIVLFATLELHHGDQEAAEAELREIVRWRREHQPGGANCGSVFTNPAGDSAGRLIDEAGLKGSRIGTASVSTKHANFIQADPNASAQDISALIIMIQTTVRERFGVTLHAEVQTLGITSLVRPNS
jgi:UDP-N-acetylmuramate dehydrogenase